MSEYPRLIQEGEEDFALNPEAESAWVTVDSVTLWIRRHPDGVIVEAYKNHAEMEDSIGEMFVPSPK